MKPFYVDTIQVQNSEKPGLDHSYIFLNCKDINFQMVVGDCIKVSKNSHSLILNKIEKIINDEIFSHWKLITEIITNSKDDYFESSELKSGQYLYLKENPNE